MTFELLPGITPFVVAFIVVAVVAGVVAVAAVAHVLLSNRRVRITRNESIPTYYRARILAH